MTPPEATAGTPDARVDVRPARTRFHTDAGWLDSWHSFSFGGHHDPGNTHHGLLLVNNDDTVVPGAGFGTHAHRDMEIVTWVLSGRLAHADSAGNEGIITPGTAQRMSAGRGIRHSEHNASDVEPVHFVQMWVLPDVEGIEPSYEQRDVSEALASGDLVVVASGQGHDGAVHLHQAGAALLAGRLTPGAGAEVPDEPHVHVFVARGAVRLEGAGLLEQGDAARLTGAGVRGLEATSAGAEVLVWATA